MPPKEGGSIRDARSLTPTIRTRNNPSHAQHTCTRAPVGLGDDGDERHARGDGAHELEIDVLEAVRGDEVEADVDLCVCAKGTK